MYERESGPRLAASLAELRGEVQEVLGPARRLVLPGSLAADAGRIRQAAERLAGLVDGRDLLDRLADGTLTAESVVEFRHDVRAHLGAVLGYAELVLEDLAVGPGDPTGAILRAIVASAARLLPVVDAVRFDEPAARPPVDAFMQAGAIEVVYDERFRGRIVLVVDDSADHRDLLVRRLGAAGLETLAAPDGTTGLQLACSLPVDLVLLDIMMPGLDGFEVLARLKADPVTRDIPVLLISGLSEVENIVRGIEAGAEDYLSTPFNATILHARIKACLDKKILHDRDRERMNQLAEARQELESAIESMEDAFAIFDGARRLGRFNSRFRQLYPGVEDLRPGATLLDLLRANWERGVYLVERRLGSREAAPGDLGDWSRLRLARIEAGTSHVERLADGRWIEIDHHPMSGGGFVAIHKDITVRKEEVDRLKHLSLHDPLTGLANRARFEERLAAAIERSRADGTSFPLLYLDLDGFKGVNDELGHAVGDDLLVTVARRLREQVREDDLVARLGGDEFAIILSSALVGDVPALADRILATISGCFEADGREVPFGVSIGIARYPDDGTDAEAFLQSADRAMYAAKKAGRGRAVESSDAVDP